MAKKKPIDGDQPGAVAAVPEPVTIAAPETAPMSVPESAPVPEAVLAPELPTVLDSEVQKEKAVVHALIVRAGRNGFRRAGIQFGTEPITLNAADLTPEQLDQFISEPLLSVAFIDTEE